VSRAGLYIAVEGGEGAGKSTQVALLADALTERGIRLVRTREPSATALGSKIRQLVLDPDSERLGIRTEALLYAADRSHHVDRVVRPALLAGRVVVQDRSVGSSLAYQSGAEGLNYDTILNLSAWGSNGIMPHMTFYLDLEPEEGLRRAVASGVTNRNEFRDIEFHRKVRESFRRQAQAHNWFLIDAKMSVEKVHEKMLDLALTQACLFGHEPCELEKQ
jgi:dTMP kinase